MKYTYQSFISEVLHRVAHQVAPASKISRREVE